MQALTIALTAAALMLSASAGVAADANWSPAPAAATKLSTARTLIAKREWLRAVAELQRVNDKRSADWNSLMGFALRQQRQPDLEAAHWYYDQALRIDPHHFGAQHYLGELHLVQNQLPKAEQRLQTLGNSCELACVEYDQLKAAIARYKAAGNRFVPQP
jgi:Flp pilus assembly protein TadD